MSSQLAVMLVGILHSSLLSFFLTRTVILLLSTFFLGYHPTHFFPIHFFISFLETILRLTDIFTFLNKFTELVLAGTLLSQMEAYNSSIFH